MRRFVTSSQRLRVLFPLRQMEASSPESGHRLKRQDRASSYRPLLANPAARSPQRPDHRPNPRSVRRTRGVRVPPPTPARSPSPRPGPRALARQAPPLADTRSCGGARVHPNPPPSGSGSDARLSLPPPPRHRCQPPSGDSICSQHELATVQAGGERCPQSANWRPLRQAAAHRLAGRGGDTLVARVQAESGLPPREERRPALRSSRGGGERPWLTRLPSDLLISGGFRGCEYLYSPHRNFCWPMEDHLSPGLL
ncbi:uncharacterized protein ACH125_023985 [Urocitellus parryii]